MRKGDVLHSSLLLLFFIKLSHVRAAVMIESEGPFGVAVRLSTLAGEKGTSGYKEGTSARFDQPQVSCWDSQNRCSQ